MPISLDNLMATSSLEIGAIFIRERFFQGWTFDGVEIKFPVQIILTFMA